MPGLIELFLAAGARSYSLVLGMISMVLTARWLGPEGRGIVVLVTTLVSAAATLGGLSLWQVLYKYAQSRPRDSWLPGYLGLVGLLQLALLLGCGGLALLYADTLTANGLSMLFVLLGLTLLPLVGLEQFGNALAQTVQRLRLYNTAVVIGRSLGLLVLPIAVVWLEWGVAGALSAMILAQLVVSCITMGPIIRMSPRITLPPIVMLKAMVGGTLMLHLNTVGTFMSNGLDVLLVGAYAGTEATAFYQMANQFVIAFMVIPTSAAMVFYQLLSEKGANEAWAQQKRQIAFVMLLLASLGALAVATAHYWIVLVAGEQFRASVNVFRTMMIVLLPMAFAVMMAPQWIVRGLYWQSSAIAIFVGAMAVGLNTVLIPVYGESGAVYTKIVTYTCAGGINLVMWMRLNRVPGPTCHASQLNSPCGKT